MLSSMAISCPHCLRDVPEGRPGFNHIRRCCLAPTPCLCGYAWVSLKRMKLHRQTCEIWQTRDVRAVSDARRRQTNLARHGFEVVGQIPEAQAKRVATNLLKYGAENPFAKESSLFESIQKALQPHRVGLHGSDNPFSRPEVKAKVLASIRAKYGVDNPQQASEVRAKTRATNLERYGVAEVLAVPAIRAAIQATFLSRYGSSFPSRHPDVLERQRQTNLARYGVEWTCLDPDVRKRQLDSMTARYGGHFFASPEGRARIQVILLERYGVDHPARIPGHWERVAPKKIATCLQRYGVRHPMMHADVFLRQKLACSTKGGPNLFERRVHRICPPGVKYVGHGIFWRRLPLLGRYKNPDFILGSNKVIECLGDYWHTRMFAGRTRDEYAKSIVDAWADVGFSCLIIWESELKNAPEAIRIRLQEFALSPVP